MFIFHLHVFLLCHFQLEEVIVLDIIHIFSSLRFLHLYYIEFYLKNWRSFIEKPFQESQSAEFIQLEKKLENVEKKLFHL